MDFVTIFFIVLIVFIVMISSYIYCNSNKQIKRSYFINLNRRIDKAKRTMSQLQKSHHPDVCRYEAIDGMNARSLDELSLKYQNLSFDPKFFVDEKIRNTKRYRAKLACWLSHYDILRKNKDLGHDKWIIILEDDIRTNYPFKTLKTSIAKTLDKFEKADLIILSDRIGISSKHNSSEQYSMYKKNIKRGTDGYAINGRGILKILDHLLMNIRHSKLSIDEKLLEMNEKGIVMIVPLEYEPYITCTDLEQKDSDIEIALDE